jgi:predicted acylesterase/phospholipase RssA
MSRCRSLSLSLALALLAGCVTTPRQAAPPALIDAAVPDGFERNVRVLSIDRVGFERESPVLLQGIRRAADGTLDILALSGGGAGGAFGAGALVGLDRAHARPRFELVTGVSAGALIAPFAFLGPDWDAQLVEAFTGQASANLQRSPAMSVASRLLFPQGFGKHDPLAALVDHYVSDAMIAAVAREWAGGRRLIVATTDLDKQETVLWDMGAIAARGGTAARKLFRDVLVASASVPGVFPPVLIRVHEGSRHYEEMHVDGGVTTSLFAAPLIAQILPVNLTLLHGAHLYVIVNGQLVAAPSTTRLSTPAILERSFSAQTTYKTRETLALTLGFAERYGLHLRVSEIPGDYPFGSFIDFRPQHLRALFDYAAGCAAQGRLWMTPAQSIRRNLEPPRPSARGAVDCPAPAP